MDATFRDSTVSGLISTSIRSTLDCPLNYVRSYLIGLLPPCVRRVVYLDSDLILVDDIAKLTSIPLTDGRVLAALKYCNANFTSYFTPTSNFPFFIRFLRKFSLTRDLRFNQLGLRSIWEKYYKEAHAVIYVIDAASPSHFEDSKSALERVLRHEDLQGAPLLILANKQDLEDAISTDELAQYLDLKKLDERVYTFQAVSAFDELGIKESVNWLVDAMKRSKRTDMLRLRAGNSIV